MHVQYIIQHQFHIDTYMFQLLFFLFGYIQYQVKKDNNVTHGSELDYII